MIQKFSLIFCNMRGEFIPIAGPLIDEEDARAVANAALYDNYANTSHSINLFEKGFAEFVDRKYAVSVPSGTAGIHLSLLTCNLQPDDEVIVPTITWIATSAPINYIGAKVVFVDIDPTTWCISPAAFERAITDKTKVVIGVDLYGGMVEWDPIIKIAKEHKIIVIEDAAEAVGSQYQGKPAGSFGDISVFSFHGSKTLSTGEGGMVVTNSEQVYKKMLVLKDHGRNPEDTTFFNQQIAFKYKMSAMQAALGYSQLKKINTFVEKKRTIFNLYQKFLGSNNKIILNAEPKGVFNSYWLVTVIIDCLSKSARNKLRDDLLIDKIQTRPFFHPLSSIPAYKKIIESNRARAEATPNAFQISHCGLNLPSALCLSERDIEYVVSRFKKRLSEIKQ